MLVEDLLAERDPELIFVLVLWLLGLKLLFSLLPLTVSWALLWGTVAAISVIKI